jgi:hypothetical protein
VSNPIYPEPASTERPPLVVETFPAEPINPSQSGTIKASWVGLVFSLLAIAGITFTDGQKNTILETIIILTPVIGSAISHLVAWRRRITANAAIKGGPADSQVMAREEVRRTLYRD